MDYITRRIGDRRQFAVEFEVDLKQSTERDVWGCLWLWVDGRCVGDSREVEIVNFGLGGLLNAGPALSEQPSFLLSMPASEGLDLVMWAIYGEDDAQREEIVNDRRSLEAFEVMPGMVGPFGHGWEAILIDDGPSERFVFRERGQSTQEVRWERGTFRRVIAEAREVFQNIDWGGRS
jgi:hypothetical protein